MKLYFKIKNKLKGKTIKALAWSFFSSTWTKIISFVISIILARLLEPEEFGVVGITLAIIAILKTISNLGFSSALIQVKKIEKGMYSTVFWFNIICSLVLYFLLFIVANYISVYFEINELALVLKVIGLLLLFDALSIIQRTNLKRKLDFKSIAVRNITADLTGGILGVISAFYGLGVYALVVQHIVRSLVGMIMFWYLGKWRPQFHFYTNHLKQLFTFGIYRFVDTLSRTFFDKISIFFIGSTFNPQILGFYSRAESFNSLIMQSLAMPLTNVLFPSFSKNQNQNDKFKRKLFLSISLVSFTVSIAIGILYTWSNDLIVLLFGKKWIPSVSIFQILILGAITKPIKSILSSSILAKGFSKENFFLNMFLYFLTILSIVIGYFYGFKTFLWSVTTAKITYYIFSFVFISKLLGIKIGRLFFLTLPYYILTLLVVYGVSFNFHENIFLSKVLGTLSLICLQIIIFSRINKKISYVFKYT